MAVYINHVILNMHQDFGEQNLDFETLSSLIQAPSLRLFLFFIFFGSYIEHFLPFMSENWTAEKELMMPTILSVPYVMSLTFT